MWENFKEFMGAPYRENMDAFRWFMLIGFILVCIILWAIILRHVREAV